MIQVSDYTEEEKGRIRLLVEALRSGQYKQGKQRLHRVSGGQHTWCCLGVACDVAIRNGLQVEVRSVDEDAIWYDGHSMYLPESVRLWYGFNRRNPIMSDQQSLTYWNDCTGVGFEGIADMIEAEFLQGNNEEQEDA
jgi:hypothetical protein